jgi:hypothetical protein
MLRYRIGRLCQVAGMIAMPAAIAAELAQKLTLGQSLLVATLGAALFLFGTRLLPST